MATVNRKQNKDNSINGDCGDSIKKNTLLHGLIPVLVWMCIIFFLSAQDGKGSANLSAGFVRYIVDCLFAFASWLDISFTDLSAHSFSYMLHGFIRKVAHFFLYSVLGFLLLRYFIQHKFINMALILAFGVGVSYASFDEWHQTFVPGRGGAVTDVLIDSSGVAFGIVLFCFITFVQRKIRKPKDRL